MYKEEANTSSCNYAALVVLACQSQNLYQAIHERSALNESLSVLKAVFLATMVLTLFIYLSGAKSLSRLVIGSTGALNVCTLLLWRIARRRYVIGRFAQGFGVRNVLIVGAGQVGTSSGELPRAQPGTRCYKFRTAARCWPFDASEEMIRQAEPHPRVRFRVSDVCSTEAAQNSFDGIVCSGVLEYLGHPEEALAEFRRVLRPGGTLLVSVPNKAKRAKLWSVYWATRFLGKHMQFAYLDHSKHGYSVKSFSTLLRRCGFIPQRCSVFGKGQVRFLKFTGTLLMFLASG